MGEKRDRAKKKRTVIRIRARRAGEGAGKGCEYKNERGNEAVLEKKKSETEHGNNVPTDQRGWTVTSG